MLWWTLSLSLSLSLSSTPIGWECTVEAGLNMPYVPFERNIQLDHHRRWFHVRVRDHDSKTVETTKVGRPILVLLQANWEYIFTAKAWHWLGVVTHFTLLRDFLIFPVVNDTSADWSMMYQEPEQCLYLQKRVVEMKRENSKCHMFTWNSKVHDLVYRMSYDVVAYTITKIYSLHTCMYVILCYGLLKTNTM